MAIKSIFLFRLPDLTLSIFIFLVSLAFFIFWVSHSVNQKFMFSVFSKDDFAISALLRRLFLFLIFLVLVSVFSLIFIASGDSRGLSLFFAMKINC